MAEPRQNKWITSHTWLLVVAVFVIIGVATYFVTRQRQAIVVTPPPIGNGPLGNLLGKLEPCPSGKSSDVQILKPTSQISGIQNKLHVNGIVKNNSKECAVKSVTLKITLSSNGQVLQERTVNLIGEVMYPAFALQPQATKEYSEDVAVYESLMTKTIGSKKLLSDVVKTEQVTSVEWVMPVPK